MGNLLGVARTADPAASSLYELAPDHPGAHDLAYRRRRALIAAASAAHEPGGEIPLVEYTEEEDAVWSVVSRELAERHERLACSAYLDASARLELPADRVPQLRDVDARLHAASGFHLRPVPGLVPARDFYAALATRTFWATQYIRHHSAPYYTPEPDIVHEIIGHARALAGPQFAELYRAAGEASLRATTPAAADFFSRVFWFSLEFGVVVEHGEPRAAGAGLLSSFGEIEAFQQSTILPFDIASMGTQEYDITRYQDVLYAAPSFSELSDRLLELFSGFDDATPRRYGAASPRPA